LIIGAALLALTLIGTPTSLSPDFSVTVLTQQPVKVLDVEIFQENHQTGVCFVLEDLDGPLTAILVKATFVSASGREIGTQIVQRRFAPTIVYDGGRFGALRSAKHDGSCAWQTIDGTLRRVILRLEQYESAAHRVITVNPTPAPTGSDRKPMIFPTAGPSRSS